MKPNEWAESRAEQNFRPRVTPQLGDVNVWGRGEKMTSDDIKGTANDVMSEADKTAKTLKGKTTQRASTLGDQLQDHASAASDAAAGVYTAAADKIAEPLGQFSGSASDALDVGHSAIASGSEQLVRQVAKQPIEALLLAGAIGYLVGWAVSRS